MIVKTDLYAQANVKWIVDMGRTTSGNQPLPDQGGTIQRPMYNVGVNDAVYAQYQISGSTVTGKTVGLEIYALNVWYNQGQEASR